MLCLLWAVAVWMLARRMPLARQVVTNAAEGTDTGLPERALEAPTTP